MCSVVKCTGHHPGVVYPLFKPYCFYNDVHYFYADDERVRLVLSVSTLCSTLMKGHYTVYHIFTCIKDYPACNIHTVKEDNIIVL